MKIIPLSEGRFTIDSSKEFVPFDTNSDDLKNLSPGSLLVEIQPFVVIVENDIIVLDTGLGYSGKDGTLQIHHNLIKNGIDPANVTKVLVTHLHKDHAGALLKEGTPVFQNATYYINLKEWEYAMEKGLPSYHISNFDKFSTLSNVVWIENGGIISKNISCLISGGHSPFHTVYWINDINETLFFGGDVTPQLQQMKTRYKTKYDANPALSMELRNKWWKEGTEKKWKFLFYHDIKHPVVLA